MNENYSLREISIVAKKVIEKSTTTTLLFYGEMGVGKTTLIQQICKNLGVTGIINSPTFSLVNEYKTFHNDTIFHFDFYRIKNEGEAYDIGIEEYLYNTHWCLIEWPENIKNLVPLNSTTIKISLLKNGKRNIQLTNNS